jgi:Fic family protein
MAFKPKFTITGKINNALLEIERARGFLDATKLKEEWITQMQSAALVLEAHHSTHIEGTELTLDTAQRILAGQQVYGVRPDDRQELLNYREAMEFVSEYLDKRTEITEGLIKNVHHILVKNVRGGTLEPGQYREVQNYVVNTSTREIIYTPPAPEDVPGLMRDFVVWLNNIGDVPPVLAAGIAQHRFVDIHPFIDGNGRAARVLCTLVLYLHGYDFKRLFSLSEFYDSNRPEYYHAIQAVRKQGMDLTPWLEYFSEGLKAQMLNVRDKGEAAIRKDLLLEKAAKSELNDRQKKVLEHLILNPDISRSEYAELFDVSLRTANYDMASLEENGFIRRTGVGRAIRYRLWPDK